MRRWAWPTRAAACLTTAAFLLYLPLWGCPHYDLGDDVNLMDAFFGAVGGTAETFNAHVLAPLTWIPHGLGWLIGMPAALSGRDALCGGMGRWSF